MKLKSIYSIRQIDYATAMRTVIKNHYLHRVAPCSIAYGLFEEGEEYTNLFNKEVLIGVITYGISCSSTLLNGICGKDESGNIYELTRLWIKDDSYKNAESFLIGNTIKLLDKEIIVSFSDISQGHIGTVYQATNFLYCGLSSKFRDPKVKGLENKHHATYAKGLTIEQTKEKFGDRLYYVDRPRKHRYIYINAKGKRQKELLSKLKYEIKPYPKKYELF